MALSGALSIPAPDAAARLRRGWGLLMKTADPGRAKNFARQLAASGFDTSIIPASSLRPLPPVKKIRKAFLSTRGVTIADASRGGAGRVSGSGGEILWRSFTSALVCAGSFFEEEASGGGKEVLQGGPGLSDIVKGVAIMAATGMPSFGKLKPKKESAAPRQKLAFYLDIISEAGPEVFAFRVSGDSFDYSYLEDRKEYSSFLNFRKLAGDVLSFLPWAIRSRGAMALGAGAGTGFRYAGRDDYEAERFWLWQLV